MKISLLIPSVSKNTKYNQRLLKNIDELFGKREDVETLLSVNDDLSLGGQYNKLVNDATGDVVVLLHDDMILHPNFIDEIQKNISEKRILTYTRIEPPIYNDTYPGKVIADYGRDIEDFKEEDFRKVRLSSNLVDGGSQLFFACYKKDYIGLDSDTYRLFCEDDDIHMRYDILGYEKKVCTAMVYHFVSKTSRTGSYQAIEMSSNRNFIRKWSFRRSMYKKKMNTVFKIKNCSKESLVFFEPFSYMIQTDLSKQEVESYLSMEREMTSFDISSKILFGTDEIPIENVNAVIEFDFNEVTNESVEIIQSLSDIIHETNDTGTYEVDCFKIKILSPTPQDVKYIC